MKQMITASVVLVGLLVSGAAFSASILDTETYTASSGNLSAEAVFTLWDNGLMTVLLTNTGGEVSVPADVLTALLFDDGAAVFTPLGAVGSEVVFDYIAPPSTYTDVNVGGEWAYLDGHGLSSTGLGVFGSPNFNGVNLEGPVALNGLQYGIVSTTDNLSLGNAPVTGGYPLVVGDVLFTMQVQGFNAATDYLSMLSNVSFQYGTALNEPNIPGNPVPPDNPNPQPVPEPASMALMGMGLMALAARKRFRV